MLKNFKKRKKNNKGFTLVELVVVIAILAILVGLLVPQYTKYVDKARKSADASNLGNMVRAVEIKAADPNGKLQPTSDAGITIKIDTSGTSITPENDPNKTAVEDAIKETVDPDTFDTTKGVKLRSKNWIDNKNTNNEITATIKIGKDYSFTTTYSSNVADYIAK